jgi:flagellin FlaB
MGMTSAQKAKQSMENGLQQASTALQVDGDVMAYVNTSGNVQVIYIPLGVTPGTGYVSFAKSLLSVSLIGGNMSYANIYNGVAGVISGSNSNLTAIAVSLKGYGAISVVYFIHGNITPFVLGPYGQALLVIHLPYGLPAYKSFTATISPSIGGAITVSRVIPPDNVTNTVIDLG